LTGYCLMWCLLVNSCVLRASKVFKNTFSRSIFLLRHVFIFFRNQYSLFLILSSRWEFPKIFITQIILSVSRLSINLYKLLRNFSGFLCSLFLLICEHNIIFRCSKISFHVFQILYLGSSCSIMSLRIFPEFLELSEYFSRLK
jgi:hypothetical protein